VYALLHIVDPHPAVSLVPIAVQLKRAGREALVNWRFDCEAPLPTPADYR
jgi:hypothetical protein